MSTLAKRFRSHSANARKKAPLSGLNLVSLMDIFTILVFFLLVNSSDVEVLPGKASVQLPESMSTQKPKQTLVLMVNDSHVMIQGQPLITVAELMANKNEAIATLQKELAYQFDRTYPQMQQAADFMAPVTIMGDKQIPFKVLKQLMLICTQARYGNISLAVEQIPAE